jgi:thymidine kinase
MGSIKEYYRGYVADDKDSSSFKVFSGRLFFGTFEIIPKRLTYDGSIKVITGPMFSGKTSRLLTEVKRYRVASRKVIVFKYEKDTRYDPLKVVTHDNESVDACVCDDLAEWTKEASNCDVIAIDEGQFMTGLVEFCDLMANMGKTVVVAMLNSTFARSWFPRNNNYRIIHLAQKVKTHYAVCKFCTERNASYSLIKENVHLTEDMKIIGTTDKYEAACRKCYFEHNKK